MQGIGTQEWAEAFRTNGNNASDSLDRVSELLEGVERNLNDLVQGLSLLGVKRCSWCKRFYRTDPGALFSGGGEVVCFECIPAWWPARREQLTCEERQKAEGTLVYWLRSFHNARSLSGSGKPDADQNVKFELVASCLECHGTGTYLGDKLCRYCAGPGAVRVIVPEKSH
jgi:hypothetical protein